MMDKEYVFYLSPERVDRFRYFHRLERGQIVRFSIQSEVLTLGERDLKTNWRRYRVAYEPELKR